MSNYTRTISHLTPAMVTVNLLLYFKARIDGFSDSVEVDSTSIRAFKVVDGQNYRYALSESEQRSIAEDLETTEGGSILAEWEQDMADHWAESREQDRAGY